MTISVNEHQMICYTGNKSLRVARLLGRLERCFAQRSLWDQRLAGRCRITAPEICCSVPGLNVLLSDKDLGIYVAENSYMKQIAQRGGQCSGLKVYACATDKENQLEIGIGQDEDVELIYFQLRQMLLELPFWI